MARKWLDTTGVIVQDNINVVTVFWTGISANADRMHLVDTEGETVVLMTGRQGPAGMQQVTFSPPERVEGLRLTELGSGQVGVFWR